MDHSFLQTVTNHANYWIYVVLMMIGLYAMITKNNLIKKLIGMSIFQTAIILFYVSIGVKEGGGIPIVPAHHGEAHGEHHANDPHIQDQDHHPDLDQNPHHIDSHTIDLTIEPEVVEFDSFINYGQPISESAMHPSGTPTTVVLTESRIETPIFTEAPSQDDPHHDDGHHATHPATNAAYFNNPLPHVLMLTAIVVGVSTLGVALAVSQLLYRDYGTLEEDEILETIQNTNDG